MKIAELKTFVVGNPPPAFGGRYFLFLKLRTACGIEGVGEVYAASFAPAAIVPMIEDVFEHHVLGGDPFRIEALWRNVDGRGYTSRPDVSLVAFSLASRWRCGTLSARQSASRSTNFSAARSTSDCAATHIFIRTSPARTSIPTARSIRFRTPRPSARSNMWRKASLR